MIITIVIVVVSVQFVIECSFAATYMLVAAIISLFGFNNLKPSNAIGELGLKAAKTLLLSALLPVIVTGMDFIPLMGWAAYILLIFSYTFQFLGWNKMNQAFE